MFIKQGKIYVYRVIEGDVFELNNYIRQFFQLDKVYSLSTTNVPFVYQHYDKEKPTRQTGNTPEKYKMLCPSVTK